MALSADRHTPYRDGELVAYPVAASAKIYAGALVAVKNAGHAAGGTAAQNLTCVGRAEEQVDNSSGSAGDKTVLVRAGRAFRWKNSAGADAIAAAQIGKDCYIVDDQTVAKTNSSNSRSKAGRVVGVDDEGVRVYVSRG